VKELCGGKSKSRVRNPATGTNEINNLLEMNKPKLYVRVTRRVTIASVQRRPPVLAGITPLHLAGHKHAFAAAPIRDRGAAVFAALDRVLPVAVNAARAGMARRTSTKPCQDCEGGKFLHWRARCHFGTTPQHWRAGRVFDFAHLIFRLLSLAPGVPDTRELGGMNRRHASQILVA